MTTILFVALVMSTAADAGKRKDSTAQSDGPPKKVVNIDILEPNERVEAKKAERLDEELSRMDLSVFEDAPAASAVVPEVADEPAVADAPDAPVDDADRGHEAIATSEIVARYNAAMEAEDGKRRSKR